MDIIMTAISTSSAALTILTQGASFAQGTSNTATDTILDIVSGRAAGNKAVDAIVSAAQASAATKSGESRAVGGSVSSEISRAAMGAMSAAGAATVNGLSYDDPLIAFTKPKASLEDAEIIAGRLAQTIADYNAQFDLKSVPSREEYMARKESWLANQVAVGASEKQIKTGLESNFGEGGYERHVSRINASNESAVRHAKIAEDQIGGGTMLLREIFGQEVSITKDQDGRLTLGAFDMVGSNGQKMLSYSADGTLSTFNSDGSLIRTLSGRDFRNL